MSEIPTEQISQEKIMSENTDLGVNQETESANITVSEAVAELKPENIADAPVNEPNSQDARLDNVDNVEKSEATVSQQSPKESEEIPEVAKKEEEENTEKPTTPETTANNQPEPYSGISVTILPEDTKENEGDEERVQTLLSGSGDNEKIDSFSDDEIVIDENGDSSSDSDLDSDSSSSSDSGSSSESSDDSDSDSDSDDATENNKEKEPMDELEEEDEAISGPILSKNEIADEKANSLPADYVIPENAPLEYIGDISGLVENSVIIKANVSGEFRILKDDSILCLEDRQLLGPLFETFGRLQAPNYRVKFNTEEDFQKVKDKKGSKVFYVVPDSQFVYTDSIKKIKGTDASNCHDEELPEEEQEYSDDEQELAAKQEKTRKRKQKKQENGEVPQKKKPAATKPENSFVSYGFAQRPTEELSRTPTQNPQLHHHNPALHGSPYPQPVQNIPNNYGMPYNQAQGNAYGQPLPNQAFTGQYQAPQPYMQQQQQPYAPATQYGQYPQAYPQAYQNPYGQPYNPAYGQAQQLQQFQQYQQPPQNQIPGGIANIQHMGNPQYGQQYQPQVLPQAYPGQQYPSNVQHPLPQLPQRPQSGQGATAPVNALQQLQQMVSQNLTKEKPAEP